MGDPTPGERANRILLKHPWFDNMDPLWPGTTLIENEIWRAVLAERERCANINPVDTQCPQCTAGPGVPCGDERNKFWMPPHIERWRAAIRKDPPLGG